MCMCVLGIKNRPLAVEGGHIAERHGVVAYAHTYTINTYTNTSIHTYKHTYIYIHAQILTHNIL